MAKPGKSKKKGVDVAVLQGPTEDGQGARILRYRDGNLSAGEVRPVQEGKPLPEGELLKLTPHAEQPALCEVEVLREDPSRVQERKQGHGPARVSNDVYRKNWNQVFGRADKDTTPTAAAKKRRRSDYTLN